MAIKIGICNKKGGISKTTTALALSAGLQDRGYKVLLVDTDNQMSATVVYRAKTEGVATLYDVFVADYKFKDCIQRTAYGDIIASDEQLKNIDVKIKINPQMYRYLKKALVGIEDYYDFIIFDTPPATGIILGNVLLVSNYIIVPCTTDSFGIQGILDFNNTVNEYKEDNPNLQILGLLITKYKSRYILTKDIETNLLPKYAKQMNTRVFKTKIRESVRCQEAQTYGQSIFKYAPECVTAIDYNNFLEELQTVLKLEGGKIINVSI